MAAAGPGASGTKHDQPTDVIQTWKLRDEAASGSSPSASVSPTGNQWLESGSPEQPHQHASGFGVWLQAGVLSSILAASCHHCHIDMLHMVVAVGLKL